MKYFFLSYKSLTKNAPKLPPKFLSLYFAGPQGTRKIPPKYSAKFLCENLQKITDELLQERREKKSPQTTPIPDLPEEPSIDPW